LFIDKEGEVIIDLDGTVFSEEESSKPGYLVEISGPSCKVITQP